MNRRFLIISLATACFFTLLFYKRDLGLNLVLFELGVLALLLATKQINFKSKLTLGMGAALAISLAFTIVSFTVFGYVLHFLVALLFVGTLVHSQAQSLTTSFALSIHTLFASQRQFFKELSHSGYKSKGIFRKLIRAGVFVAPAIIVMIFFLMYQRSSPVFERIFAVPMERLQEFFSVFFRKLNFLMIFTFLFGLVICNSIFLRRENADVITLDRNATEAFARKRKNTKWAGAVLSLKNEYRAAIFLFLALNLLLCLLDVADIYSVWFHFEWKGQYLKQYVHEGTYLLILSILLSIILVLYYFRGNLNHYPKQRLLKTLALIWLAQNAILILSVSIRNFWYIHYFALAYKRIGVYIFLALTLFGLYSVWVKVARKKTMFYLYRVNAVAWTVLLTLCSIVNWDTLIARYNFSKSGKAFLHLNFLATLPDKSLPYLDKSYGELVRIDSFQKNLFHFNETFMTPAIFYHTVQTRKRLFKEKWNNKDWLEWNYAEWRAYRKMLKKSVSLE